MTLINIGNKTFELDKVYNIPLNSSIQDEMIKYVSEKFGVILPDNFIFDWTVTVKNDYGTGTLSKRIKKFLLKNYNIQMDNLQMSDMAAFYNSKTVDDDHLSIKFVNKFWNPGYIKQKLNSKYESTDENSCWHTFNCGAVDFILDYGGYFILILDRNGVPTGRALMMPVKGCWTLSNEISIKLDVLSSALSEYSGLSVKRYKCARNTPCSIEYGLYSNSGGVHVIGSKTKLKSISHNVWSWDDQGYDTVYYRDKAGNRKFATTKYYKERIPEDLWAELRYNKNDGLVQ